MHVSHVIMYMLSYVIVQIHLHVHVTIIVYYHFLCASFPTTGCESDEFSCDNGECISDISKCNDLDDCGDNSDEDGCGMI